MQTPIVDFVRRYQKDGVTRFHMPGHKGQSYLGCEWADITEICGADSLYEADGIIAESEENASALFGSGRTFYSTEGSSQCIRAMLSLALSRHNGKERPVVLAARNVHKAFVYAAALLDFDVEWLWPEDGMKSLCSCKVSPAQVEKQIARSRPVAVYLTSPDYLGGQMDIHSIAEVCHREGVLLLVDNAHGAYLHFLKQSVHPLDLGADMCCDSAHKTFPVLTGGAYLHLHKNVSGKFGEKGKQALALFGSTSPSYLILESLDLCNAYLSEGYQDKLMDKVNQIQNMKERLTKCGWEFEESDPLKITICASEHLSGRQIAELLRRNCIECEYADEEYCVLMCTPDNSDGELDTLYKILHAIDGRTRERDWMPMARAERILSIREAVFAPSERIPVSEAEGRICATPTVGCPPAIPIAVSGEKIGLHAIQLFEHYGITQVEVVKKGWNHRCLE